MLAGHSSRMLQGENSCTNIIYLNIISKIFAVKIYENENLVDQFADNGNGSNVGRDYSLCTVFTKPGRGGF